MQDNELIKTIPDIPEEILDAIDNNNFVLFIGAGVSKLYGLPLWSELANILLDKCVKDGIIDNLFRYSIKKCNYSPLRLITIIVVKIDEVKGKGKGIKYICSILNSEKTRRNNITRINKLSNYLSNFNCPIITTNADIFLDRTKNFDKKVEYDYLSNEATELLCKGIIHIHGSVNRKEDMIFTAKKYAESYYPDSEYGERLKRLFSNYSDKTILFIGYGMEEFELVRYFINNKRTDINRLFILNGYYANQNNELEFDKLYFNELGIKIIPYSLNEKEYDGLFDILENWNVLIERLTIVNSGPYFVVKNLANKKPINDGLKNNMLALNRQMNPNDFCNAIKQSKYLSEWVNVLSSSRKLFSAKQCFKPMKKISNGYTVVFWPGLELIAESVKKDDINTELAIKVINNSIRLLKKDKSENVLDRIGANSGVMQSLIECCLVNENIIKTVDFKTLINYYLDNNNEPYILQMLLLKNINVFKTLDENTIFITLTSLLEKSDIGLKELFNDNIKELIRNNAYKYYDYIKVFLEKFPEFKYGTIGALYNHSKDYERQFIVAIDWLKESIKVIDDRTIYNEFVNCLNSENRFYKKLAILIATLRYEICEEYLWKSHSLFHKCCYLDLVTLLENVKINNKEIVDNYVSKIDIQTSNANIELLKNNLRSKYDTSNTVSKTLNKIEKSLVNNYGKLTYEIDDSENSIYEKLKNKTYDEARLIVEDIKKDEILSFSFTWKEDFIKYLKDDNWNIFEKNIDSVFENMDNDCMTEMNYSLAMDKKLNNSIKLHWMQKIYQILDYNNFELMKSFLFLLNRVNNDDSIKEYMYELELNKIITADTSGDNDTNHIINTNTFQYLEFISNHINFCLEKDRKLLADVLNTNKLLVKQSLACVYSNLNVSDDYRKIILDYVTNVSNKNKKIIYDCLVTLFTPNEFLIDYLIKKQSFINYLYKEIEDKSNNQQTLYFECIISFYIYKNRYKNLITKALINVTVDSISNITYFIAEIIKDICKDDKRMERTNALFCDIVNCLDKKDYVFEKFEASRITDYCCICYLESNKKISEAIILAIKIATRYDVEYIYDGVINMIKSDPYNSKIVKLCDILISKCKKRTNRYDNVVIEIYKLYRELDFDKKKLREWKAILINKNPDILNEL